MADRSRGLSWLRESGYTQTCMARGTVTWNSKDYAARELQLWYHERDDDYCLYACKTARDDMVFYILPETTMKVTKDTVTISELQLYYYPGPNKQNVQLKDADPNELQLFIDKMPATMKVIDTYGQQRRSEEQLRRTEEQRRVKDEQLKLKVDDEQLREKDKLVREKDKQLRAKDEQLKINDELLREKDKQAREKDKQLRITEEQLQEKDKQVQEKDEQLRRTQKQLRVKEEQKRSLQRQLSTLEGDKKKENANFQEQLNVKVQELTDLRKELRDREQDNVVLENDLSAAKEKLAEYESQLKARDWVLCRDEVQLSDESLGAGALGRVVKGRYCGCVVAIKQLHQLTLTQQERRLFEREMDIASRCRHPCLLQFIGATQDERPLFVTEIMEKSLRKLLGERQKDNQHLTETEIIFISLDVAQALNYLHQRKPEPIVHRDVSSANVLLWKRNNQWRGKLGDYGTAKFLQETMTIAPGAMIYAAPEIGCPFKQTVKIDVYSFGVLFCEMCTGELPEPEKREEQARLVPNKKFGELILWCIEEDPEMRPSMEEIIEKLERLNNKS